MNNQNLIQLIRESIQNYISEIDYAGENAACEAKINAIGEAITTREKKMNMEGIDEAYHDMIDKSKMKELASEIKALKKSLAKYQKQLEKLKSKGNKSEKVEDTEKEEIIDEVSLNENKEDFDLESYFQKANKEYGWDFDETRTVEGDLEYGDESWERTFAKKLMNIGELSYNEWKAAANEAYNASQVNESDDMNIYEVLHMQKLAGIITEEELNTKLEEAKKKASAGMTKKEKSAVVIKARAGKDIGKKGKGFEKVEKAAEKEYGSKEAGKKVAAAAMWRSQAKK
jgi:hypothetical protein